MDLHKTFARAGIARFPMTPTPAMAGAFASAARLGISQPVLFGGAIRDHYLGIVAKDYDILGHIWDVADKRDFCKNRLQALDRPDDIGMLSESIEQRLREAGFAEYERNCVDTRHQDRYGYLAQYKLYPPEGGLPIDIVLEDMDSRDIAAHIIKSDAPINSAMLTADGICYADPQFEDHVEKKIYQCTMARFNKKRFERLAAKVPGLILQLGA